jgi:L-malate glycosyltransferase
MKREKYILQVMGMHSFKYGGLEQFMVSLAEELSKHQIKLILMYDSYPHSEKFISKLCELKVEIVVTNPLKPIRFLFDYVLVLFKYKPIVVHSHFEPLFAVFYSKFFGIKNRLVSLRLMMTDNHFNEVSDIKKLGLYTRIQQWVINFCSTKLLPVSNAVKQQFQRLHPETASKLEVFYMGAFTNNFNKSLTREHLNFSNDFIYIACVAFCDKMKGIEILIEASGILKKIDGLTNFKVCLIGLDEANTYTNELKQLSVSYSLENNIIWFGIRDDISELLSAMDIYCQPSRTDAMPFAIMEAGMAGLPCIGSNIGGIPEEILHNQTGFLYNVGDAAQLANFIKILMLSESLRQKMGANAREHMLRNFNIAEQIKKMTQIYLDLLNKKL